MFFSFAEHFHYIKRMIGADHVGIGGDFDGVNRLENPTFVYYFTNEAQITKLNIWLYNELYSNQCLTLI